MKTTLVILSIVLLGQGPGRAVRYGHDR
jgi:hypothetical protein